VFRSFIKGGLETGLVASGCARRRRRKQPRRLVVLSYHNIVPPDYASSGDPSLHLPLDRFGHQLDVLQNHFDIVSLRELGNVVAGPRPQAAITFDDAYRGALELVIPDLARRGLPGTVFVCPGLLGAEGFWWDRLGDQPEGLTADPRQTALKHFQGQREEILRAHPAAVAIPDPMMIPGTAEGLAVCAQIKGITLASHTWSHPNLAEFSENEVEMELRRSVAWLQERHSHQTREEHLSLLYGLYDEKVLRVARKAGFRFLYRVEGGAPTSPFRIQGCCLG
jgi:peptidoglycan/xylan/chitin deacetylase (PgdA/CDA1 family)